MHNAGSTRRRFAVLLAAAVSALYASAAPSLPQPPIGALSASPAAPGDSKSVPTPPTDRTIQFGGDRLFPPFEWLDENGQPQGFQVELVRAIAAKMNFGVEVRLADWSFIREEFVDGSIDVVGMFDAPPRRESALFGDPHTVAASEIFVRRGEADYRSLEDLRGKRVIVQAAGLAADRFAAEHLGVSIIPVATEAEALQLLASGTGDAAVVTSLGGRGAMARHGLTNITTTGPPVLESHYALCVRPGNEELLAKLNQGLAILKRTGEYNALYQRWFGDVDRPSISSRQLALYAAIAAGAVLFYVLASLAWTRLLQRRVDERTRQLQTELGERARVQAELQRSERRFRELIEHAPEAILVVDPHGPTIVAANPNAERLFGLHRDRILAADPRELVGGGSGKGGGGAGGGVDWAAADPAAVSTVPREVRVLRSDGTEADCELRLAALPNAGAGLLRASLLDVSERRRAERRQRILIDELDHRVKNTLASVIGLSEGLIRASGSLPEFRDAFVPRVHAMARAHEALAASKWEGVRLSQALRLVVRSVPEASSRRITLTGDDPLIGPEQSLALCLVIHELAVNSIRHGALARPEGGVELACQKSLHQVRITWSEPARPEWDARHNHPDDPHEPLAEGFGLALVRGLVEHQLRGQVRFDRRHSGYYCEIAFEPSVATADGIGAATVWAAPGPTASSPRETVR